MGILLQSCLQDSVLEPNEIDHFLKGELDPRPTFQRAFVPSKKIGQSYRTYGSLKNEGENVMPKCLPQCVFAPSNKVFPYLGNGFRSSLGWFSRREPSGLIGLGKYVMLFNKGGRGIVCLHLL